MYQIFYIDIDEEITSVIDRLKKSKATENFFVVSPRSLILQSIVSLKLLKRESAKEKKQIAIVVNDKIAGMKVEKAGILVLSSLKGLEGEEEIKESFGSKIEEKKINNINKDNKNKHKSVMEKNNKKTRLQKIGTDNFFNEEAKKEESLAPINNKIGNSEPSKSDFSRSREPVIPAAKAEQKNTSDIKKENTSFSYAPEKNFEEFPAKPEAPKNYSINSGNRISDMKEMDPYKEKLVEGFFRPETEKTEFKRLDNPLSGKNEKSAPVSGGIKKIIFSFVFISLLISLAIAAYLFLPKAEVEVSLRDEIKKFDLEVKGDAKESEVKSMELSIPAKIIEKEYSFSESFKATGKKTSASDASKKAKGKLTIYNNYDKESQQLVATTRFLSTDGKLFRLVKGVAVPGMKEVDGKLQPGSIEAEVIADQPGEDYNIGPSDFKIPGFEGSPKYDKFYGKSTANMSGGGSGGSSGIVIISQSDLDNAKKTTEEKIKIQMEDEIKKEIGAGNILLAEASEKTITESFSSGRANEVAGNFDYNAKGKIKAVVFSESDLKKLAGNIYNEANKEKTITDYSLIKITYGASSADLSSGIINLKINVEVPVNSDIDWNDFKMKILGKNDDQIKEILKEYPQIEKVNIDFWPKFLSQKIPQYEKRVEIKVSK